MTKRTQIIDDDISYPYTTEGDVIVITPHFKTAGKVVIRIDAADFDKVVGVALNVNRVAGTTYCQTAIHLGEGKYDKTYLQQLVKPAPRGTRHHFINGDTLDCRAANIVVVAQRKTA